MVLVSSLTDTFVFFRREGIQKISTPEITTIIMGLPKQLKKLGTNTLAAAVMVCAEDRMDLTTRSSMAAMRAVVLRPCLRK